MKKTLVWDIPVRLVHWGLAGSLTVSLAIALFVDDDHPLFQLHMLLGLVSVFLVVMRVLLGLVGSRHARFGGLPLRPSEVVRYFAGVLRGRAASYAGNNPGSALAALAMFVLVALLAATGLAGGEALEETHEVLAWLLAGVIGAHVLGIVLHVIQHRENLAAAMITGRKARPPEDAIGSAHPVWGGVVLAACLAWVVALFAGHDPGAATVRLPLVGAVVALGESESGTDRGSPGASHGHRDHERDD